MLNLMFIDASQITLIVVVAALLILYPVFLYYRNKKDKEKRDNLYSTIKKGDYVITYSGIMGKVIEIVEKQNGKFVTLQTGEGMHSGYVCITIDAIYSFADTKDKIYGVDGAPIEEKAEAKAEEEVEPKAEEKVEVSETSEEKSAEAPKKTKKKPSKK